MNARRLRRSILALSVPSGLWLAVASPRPSEGESQDVTEVADS